MATAAIAVPTQGVDVPAKTVVISPGDRIEFTIGPGREPLVTSRGPVNAADSASIGKVDNSTEAVFSGPLEGHPTKERLTAYLLTGPDGFRLVILNGYQYPIAYEAALVVERNGKRVYEPTSVCPVRAGNGGVESWAEPALGIALTDFHAADPKDLACSGGSLLTVSPPDAGPERFACVGGDTPGKLAPLTVTLVVNSSGAVQRQSATWVLPSRDFAHAPGLVFDFGMMGRSVSAPSGLSVLAVVSLRPPPKAKRANIVLLLDGTEKARRPWQMYARAMAAPVNPSKTPTAFVGIVPFYPRDDEDAGLKTILAAIGRPGATLEARIIGDDSSILSDGTFPINQPAVRDTMAVNALLDQALILAKTPTRCPKLAN
ncbi:MAG TPA: hypothetical protein VG166_15560 [Caulobacteraceae bacterium]|nr:hypothetical protein [Caulobacteraceae bacterium]